MTNEDKLRIGIVAGEVSGDYLGAELIKEIKKQRPEIECIGIGGDMMRQQGCVSLFSMKTLSIIGYLEAFLKYIKIIGIRRRLIKYYLGTPPLLFIGIDVPDFNLKLEKKLKAAGIPTVHYVSPTVWAWRSYRIHQIKRSVGHMLTLFPFEAEYYRKHDLPVTFVGHPLADKLKELEPKKIAREALGIGNDVPVLAILPGSRKSEIKHHSALMAKTIKILAKKIDNARFIVPMTGQSNKKYFKKELSKVFDTPLSVDILDGQAHRAMRAADIVVLASGTATLEAALLERLMIVFYRLSWFSYFIIRMLSHVKQYSLPNNLVGYGLVPEFMQSNATAEKLADKVIQLLGDEVYKKKVAAEFKKIRNSLQKNASATAASTVLSIIEQSIN